MLLVGEEGDTVLVTTAVHVMNGDGDVAGQRRTAFMDVAVEVTVNVVEVVGACLTEQGE